MTMTLKHLEHLLRPDDRTLRQFGWIACGVFGALAACARYEAGPFSSGLGAHRLGVAGALAAVAAVSGACALLWPRGNRALYVALSVVAYPIGWIVSYAVLGVLFFAVLTPIGLALRAAGVDPLQRTRTGARSYWTKTRAKRSKESYFRQF